jgi:hypothetical protein
MLTRPFRDNSISLPAKIQLYVPKAGNLTIGSVFSIVYPKGDSVRSGANKLAAMKPR